MLSYIVLAASAASLVISAITLYGTLQSWRKWRTVEQLHKWQKEKMDELFDQAKIARLCGENTMENAELLRRLVRRDDLLSPPVCTEPATDTPVLAAERRPSKLSAGPAAAGASDDPAVTLIAAVAAAELLGGDGGGE